MMGDYYEFTVSNPGSVEIPHGPIIRFASEHAITAKAEEPALETLLDLWMVGGPYSMERISRDPWLAAVFFRLCRAKAVRIHAGTGEVYADRRKQSAATEDALPAEVRDHPAQQDRWTDARRRT
jgi:hypothetical protein